VSFLKQKVGNKDTKHGMLDLPVAKDKAMKKPKMRFADGGYVQIEDPKTAPKDLVKKNPKDSGAKEEKPTSLMDRFTGRAQRTKVDKAVDGYKKGGSVRPRDGCATRGKTKGAMR